MAERGFWKHAKRGSRHPFSHISTTNLCCWVTETEPAMDVRSQQPGLEVVPPDSDKELSPKRHNKEANDIERVPAEYDGRSHPQAVLYDHYLHPVQGQTDAYKEAIDRIPDRPRPWYRRRRTRLVLIAVLIIVIIAGVAVGSVIGTSSKRGQADGASNGSSNGGNNGGNNVGSSNCSGDDPMRGSPGSPTSAAPGIYPTAISYGFPHLEIIALASNSNSVWRRYRPSNATSIDAFEPPGGLQRIGSGLDLGKTPSLSVTGRFTSDTTAKVLVNRTEIHLADSTGAGYRKYHDDNQPWTGSEKSWDAFPHNLLFRSAATQVTTFRRELELMKTFAIAQGESGAGIWYIEYYLPDHWQTPTRIPSVGPDLHAWAPPTVVAWNGDDTRLDVIAVSSVNNHLIHVYKDTGTNKNATWSEPEDLGGFVTTAPALVSRTPGTLDVFARGGDGGLWHLAFDKGHWANWTLISGTTKIQGQPDAVPLNSDTVGVFAWGQPGGEMLYRRLSPETGTLIPAEGFQAVKGVTLSGPPKAVTDGTSVVNVFAYDQDRQLVWQTFGTDNSAAQGQVKILGKLPTDTSGASISQSTGPALPTVTNTSAKTTATTEAL
ncbi:acyl-CoA dehydrogenase domain-containing protein [Apiospora arundinis]